MATRRSSSRQPRRVKHPGESLGAMAAATFLAVLATVADMIRDTTGFSSDPLYLIKFAWHLVLFLIMFRLGFATLDWLSRPSAEPKGWVSAIEELIAIPSTYHPQSIVRTAAPIFTSWLPMLILLFPGVIWYDTRQQLLQFFGLPNNFTAGALSDHHPVFDTLLYGAFADIGRRLGSADLGVYAFCLIQAAAVGCALACCLVLVKRAGATSRTLVALSLVLCINPLFPAYASAMAKDATFLPFFLLFGVSAIEIARSAGAVLRRRRNAVAFACLALMCCLTRKTGLIMVLVVCGGLAIHMLRCKTTEGQKAPCRQALRGVTIAAGISLAVVGALIPRVVLPALNAEPGGSQEVLGLLFQQSSRLMKECGETVPAWQRTAIEDLLGDDVADRYSWWITDTVKDPVTKALQTDRIPAYLAAWAAGLIAHPLLYLETYAAVEIGWYAAPSAASGNAIMFETPIDAHEMDHTFEGSDSIGLIWTDASAGAIVERLDTWILESPVGMLGRSKALWSTWTLVFLLVACRRRAPKRLTWLLPLIAANLVLWASPTSVTREAMRYLLPVLFLAPVSWALIARPARPQPIDQDQRQIP